MPAPPWPFVRASKRTLLCVGPTWYGTTGTHESLEHRPVYHPRRRQATRRYGEIPQARRGRLPIYEKEHRTVLWLRFAVVAVSSAYRSSGVKMEKKSLLREGCAVVDLRDGSSLCRRSVGSPQDATRSLTAVGSAPVHTSRIRHAFSARSACRPPFLSSQWMTIHPRIEQSVGPTLGCMFLSAYPAKP